MRLIDANIFIYAVGRPHPYRGACRGLLAQLEERTIEGNIDIELLQEVLALYWRQGRLDEGLALFDRLFRAFPNPMPVTNDVVLSARYLLARYPAVGPRDAIHAAVVIAHGLDGIISTDRGFDQMSEITRFDPMDLT